MRYIPNTPQDQKRLLDAVGAPSVEALFESIPEELRLRGKIGLPDALAENQVRKEMERLTGRNRPTTDYVSFLGAGAYHHYVPAALNHLLQRAEFLTAYTPYQPERSQGTLQAIFEYQTMMSMLSGLDIANASMYDGASASAEACLMSLRLRPDRRRILAAQSVDPEYREIMHTYTGHIGVEIIEVPFEEKTGLLSKKELEANLDESVAAVVIQSPNFFGAIEDVQAVADAAHGAGALLVAAVAEPLSLALLKPPGEQGADIVVGEAQAFGLGLQFGGPYLGFMTARDEFKRQMPGRIAGETVDKDGRRGFVLTLVTREPHIRRARATSNICTDETHCALAASIYLSLMGRRGLRRMAEHNARKAHLFAEALTDIPGVERSFSAPFFNEFTVRLPQPSREVLTDLRELGIVGGYPLVRTYPGREHEIIVCVTEMNRRRDLVTAAEAFRDVLR
ncbi:MAG: aminomethyl-transferring glycine dehydrogenase subunit GcvPA [Acidobacteriota bacterium]|nr:MAG: aminomethyl-transferring glycine dehydrogenase subunit GcvPA [Acidobacteriota bacterium]